MEINEIVETAIKPRKKKRKKNGDTALFPLAFSVHYSRLYVLGTFFFILTLNLFGILLE